MSEKKPARTITIHARDKDVTGELVFAVFVDDEGDIQIAVESLSGDDDHDTGHFFGAVMASICQNFNLDIPSVLQGTICMMNRAVLSDALRDQLQRSRH